jgi:hypothetical protein
MKMEQKECSETLTYKILRPGNYPEEGTWHSKHGKSLKSRKGEVIRTYATKACKGSGGAAKAKIKAPQYLFSASDGLSGQLQAPNALSLKERLTHSPQVPDASYMC